MSVNNVNSGSSPVSRDDENRNKPRALPPGRKDFSKVLKDDTDRRDDDEDQVDAASENAGSVQGMMPKKKPVAKASTPTKPSLLSLASQTRPVTQDPNMIDTSPDDDISDTVAESEEAGEEVAALQDGPVTTPKPLKDIKATKKSLLAQMSTKGSQQTASMQGAPQVDTPLSTYRKLSDKDSDAKSSIGKKKGAKFMEERTDLSAVNPAIGSIHLQTSATGNAPVAPRAAYLQDIVNQMVKELTILQKNGLTETTVTIKNNPLFNGAQIVITGFDHATREFNVTFQNLTLPAKQLLDVQRNQDDLKKAMAEKEFTVHIIITTTETENPYAGGRERDQQGQGFAQDQQQREGNPEEETT